MTGQGDIATALLAADVDDPRQAALMKIGRELVAERKWPSPSVLMCALVDRMYAEGWQPPTGGESA